MPFDKYDESETIQHPSGIGWINQMRSGRKMVPRFEGEKDIYSTAEEADSMAAKRSQYEYDELRRDPKNQWYMPGTAAPPLLKNPGPSMHTSPTPEEHSMNPIDTILSGLQALDMGKMSTEGFDVNAHHERMLSTGPFAEAAQRQSVWDRVNTPLEDAAAQVRASTSNAALSPDAARSLQPLMSDDVLKLKEMNAQRDDIEKRYLHSQNQTFLNSQGAAAGGQWQQPGNFGASAMTPALVQETQAQKRARWTVE